MGEWQASDIEVDGQNVDLVEETTFYGCDVTVTQIMEMIIDERVEGEYAGSIDVGADVDVNDCVETDVGGTYSEDYDVVARETDRRVFEIEVDDVDLELECELDTDEEELSCEGELDNIDVEYVFARPGTFDVSASGNSGGGFGGIGGGGTDSGGDDTGDGGDDTCDDTGDGGTVPGGDVSGISLLVSDAAITITTTAGNGSFSVGLAQTGVGKAGWYGEDCQGGAAGYDVCHTGSASTDLTVTTDISTVADGTTLHGTPNGVNGSDVTVYVDDNGTCYTTGNDTSYYSSCTAL